MDRDPYGVDGFHECPFLLVGDDRGCMSSGAAIQHMEDDKHIKDNDSDLISVYVFNEHNQIPLQWEKAMIVNQQ